MSLNTDNAERIKWLFGHKAHLDVPMMLGVGVNPFYAWMRVKGVSRETLIEKLNLGQWYAKNLHFFGDPQKGLDTMLDAWLSIDTKDPMPADVVVAFCDYMEIEPQDLIIIEKLSPAPANVVEAAVQIAKIDKRQDGEVRPSIAQFLRIECIKVDYLYEDRGEGEPVHEYMLEVAEMSAYDGMDENEADIHDPEEGDYGLSPVELCRYHLDSAILTYRDQLLASLEDVSPDLERARRARKRHLSDLQKCALRLAPMYKQGAWIGAVNRAVNKHGLEAALGMLGSNPNVFHKVRDFWNTTSLSVILDDGRFVGGGQNVLDQFCRSYRDFKVAAQKHYFHNKKHRDIKEDLVQLDQWRVQPKALVYLDAVANNRYIMDCFYDDGLDLYRYDTPEGGGVSVPGNPLRP